jgi:hypothetical protein
MKTELVNFTKEEVEKVWPLVESLVQKACKTNGGYNAEHILDYLKKGTMQLWVAIDEQTNKVICCCVTELRQYPNFKVCDLRITTGEQFERWYITWITYANGLKQMAVQRWKFCKTRMGANTQIKRIYKTHVQIEKPL